MNVVSVFNVGRLQQDGVNPTFPLVFLDPSSPSKSAEQQSAAINLFVRLMMCFLYVVEQRCPI